MIENGTPPTTALRNREWIEFAGKGGCLTEQLNGLPGLGICKKAEVQREEAVWTESLQYEESGLTGDLWRIESKIRNGEVDDYASKALKSLRDNWGQTPNAPEGSKMHCGKQILYVW